MLWTPTEIPTGCSARPQHVRRRLVDCFSACHYLCEQAFAQAVRERLSKANTPLGDYLTICEARLPVDGSRCAPAPA
jgi:hypothetical protein